MLLVQIEFVFVHSYSSLEANWNDVMIGDGDDDGRVTRAVELAKELNVPLIANDALDVRNISLFDDKGIRNLRTALSTQDEVSSALSHSENGRVLFVTSPDHLPRVARDAMALNATRSFFAASDVPFSKGGAANVFIDEPTHRKQ